MAFSPSRSKCSRTMASWGWLVSAGTSLGMSTSPGSTSVFREPYDDIPVIDSLLSVEKKTKGTAIKSIICFHWLLSAVPPCRHGWSVSHPHGWLPFMWNDGKDVGFVIFAHMSCSSPCILFLCYIYVCVWWCTCWFICFSIGSGRYFLVSVRVSVVASCSFLCSQLSSYIVFLPAFQSTYLTVYLSTCRHICLPIYLSIIDLSTISISTVLLTDHLLICSSAFTL